MTELELLIRSEIRDRGPMRFDRFMEMALYQPGLGYYVKSAGPLAVGRSGDFYTSVSVGPLFGRLLARQFLQMWQGLGKPSRFWLIEQGAHDGQLARDILMWCRAETPEFFAAIWYGIVHPSGKAEIKPREVQEAEQIADLTWFENWEAVAAVSPTGVFFSNELVDAFPVRAIVYRKGKWLEQYVTTADEGFVWFDRPVLDDELKQAIAELPLLPIEGYTTEINLRARHWMTSVGKALTRGYVLTIDYGYPAWIYYADFRSHGTLTAYLKHKANDEVLQDPGGQDLTAHVDFTALAKVGETVGLTTLGFLDQQHLLMGIAHDELSGAEGPKVKLAESLRAWNSLTHPDFLGTKFLALLQGKDAPRELDGLRFARPGGLEPGDGQASV